MIDPKALVVSLYKRDFAKIDLSAFDNNYQRKVWVALGNRCIEDGMLNKALRAYNKAGIEIDKETLTNLIKSVFDEDVISEPFRNYQYAGIEIDKEKLIKKGFEIADDYGYYDVEESVKFFKKLYYKAGILEIGDKLFYKIRKERMEEDKFNIDESELLLWVYEQAEIKLAAGRLEMLKTVIDILLEASQYKTTLRALKLLNDRNKTLKVAEEFIKQGYYHGVLGCYKLAGETINQTKLNETGNKFLAAGKKRRALRAFQDAGNEQMVQFLKINYGLKD